MNQMDDLPVSLLSALWWSRVFSTGAWWGPTRVGAPIWHTDCRLSVLDRELFQALPESPNFVVGIIHDHSPGSDSSVVKLPE